MIDASGPVVLGRYLLSGEREHARVAARQQSPVWQREKGEISRGLGIDNDRTRGQISCTCRCRGNRIDSCHAERLTQTLIIDEEEGFLGLDRTSQTGAELIASERRLALIEMVLRI